MTGVQTCALPISERREYSRIILELRLPFFGDLRPLRQSEISGAATNKSTGMGTLYSVGSDSGVSESISTTTRDVFLLPPILSRGIGSSSDLRCSLSRTPSSICIILYIIHHLSTYVNSGPVIGRRWF